MQFCSVEKCSYPNFGKDKLTGLPYCRNHQTKRTDFDRRTIIQKAIAKNKSLGSKIRGLQNVDDEEKNELELWFLMHMNTSKKVCENCGGDLSHYDNKAWRGSQHHIIEKSKINGCPSVATEPLNHGVLGRWCCHPQWHTSYQNAVKMPFFKIAKERFELFKDKIIESERKKIPQCFL